MSHKTTIIEHTENLATNTNTAERDKNTATPMKNRRELMVTLASGLGATALMACRPEDFKTPDLESAGQKIITTDISTISALRLVSPPSSGNPTRLIGGYAQAADGGGGIFQWKIFPSSPGAPADDDLTIIKPNSYSGFGRWVRMEALSNIAILKRIPAPKGGRPSFDILGYFAPGDGGGGRFVWDPNTASPDNGGTVISPDTNPIMGRWIRDFVGAASVRWFGAKGDGTTDDHAAITRAISYAANIGARTGGEVYFPAGTYAVTAPITFGWHTTLKGEPYAAYPDIPYSGS